MSDGYQRRGLAQVSFYPDDWLGGTLELNPEQRGVYITLCALYWSKNGRVADDDLWLARTCNTTRARFRKIRDQLIAIGKIQFRDGWLVQDRAETERVNAQKRRENASKMAQKRHKNTPKNDALQRGKLLESLERTAKHAGQEQQVLPNPYPSSESPSSIPTPMPRARAREDDDGPSDNDVEAVLSRFEAARQRHWPGAAAPRGLGALRSEIKHWLGAGYEPDALAAELEARMARNAARGHDAPGRLAAYGNTLAERLGERQARGGSVEDDDNVVDFPDRDLEILNRNWAEASKRGDHNAAEEWARRADARAAELKRERG